MKTLTANALAELATKLGTEPLTLVAIDWLGIGKYFIYSDRVVSGITTRVALLECSSLNTTPSSKAGQATDLNVLLDDTDGYTKNLLNTINPYHKPVIVYQFFKGLTTADKFVLFKGVVDTPIQWSENERTISLQFLTEIEDQEIGVSLEETDIIDTDPDVNTPPWPLAFGNVVHVPATRVTQYPIAKLAQPFCCVDQMLYAQMRALEKAWVDQQVITYFWQLVHQGASGINADPLTLYNQYIYWIKLEYYYEGLVNGNKEDIAEANDLRHQRRNKNAVEEARIDDIPGLRAEIRGWKTTIKNIQYQKELTERMIDLAQYEIDLKSAVSQNIIACVDGLMNIYQTYVKAMLEACRQSDCAITEIKVEDNEEFVQDEKLTLIIANMKWLGQFHDDILTIHPTPLARYSDVPLAERQSAVDDCGTIEEMKGVDLFWIEDASYNLTNMYLLVRNRNNNTRHIIKVIEQDGTKCRYQLVPFGSYNYQGQYGASVVRGGTALPTIQTDGWRRMPGDYAGPDPDIDPWTELSPLTLQALLPAVPNDDETRNLRQLEKLIPRASTGPLVVMIPSPRDIYTIIGPDIAEIEEASPVPLPAWFDYSIYLEEYPNEIRWTANVGDEIREDGTDHDIYVANILPSTIKAIHAYRTVNDERILTQVPTSYYSKNEAEPLYDINGNLKLTVTSIRLKVPLGNIQGEQWDNQIYVTMDSSVGPNTVDIIEHLITTYTDKSIDSISFDATKIALENYPSSFAIFDRPNIYDIISEIAMFARCVVFLSNDVFYIKYLAAEPSSDTTLTESDISGEEPFALSYGDNSLVTKLLAKWRPNYLPDKERYLTLRHNVAKYGLHEDEKDFFIYNIESLVIKSATFWLIRWANLWKRVTFTTFLPQLKLDIYDTVTFDLHYTHLASTAIKGVIESIVYSNENNTIDFSCWLPVRIGEMSQYEFAWPATAAETAEFPTDIEIEQGDAGGNGIGRGIVTIIQGQ